MQADTFIARRVDKDGFIELSPGDFRAVFCDFCGGTPEELNAIDGQRVVCYASDPSDKGICESCVREILSMMEKIK